MQSSQEQQLDPLSKLVVKLQKLNPEERKYKALYENIRRQCLVEIYTSPTISNLISEEELSGFLLYLDERLEQLVQSYKPDKNNFKKYLIQAASFRALNYISKKIRMSKMDFALSKYVFTEEQTRIYNSQLHAFVDEPQKVSIDEEAIKFLRYMCIKRPSFHRKIFIYLLVVFPNLSSNTIDDFCSSFNIDIDQTLRISENIFEKSADKHSFSTRQKFLVKRNKNWSHILYLQTELERANEIGTKSEQLELEMQANKYRERNEYACSKLETIKKKMRYSIIANELNIPTGTVSSSVYFMRNVLKAIGIEQERKRWLQASVKEVELPVFKPFFEFGLPYELASQELLEE